MKSHTTLKTYQPVMSSAASWLNLFLCRSRDDPFAVYAALLNGPGTYIVTQDELRDHLYLMETSQRKRNFLRWQRQHQTQPRSMYKAKNSNQWRFTVKVRLSFCLYM